MVAIEQQQGSKELIYFFFNEKKKKFPMTLFLLLLLFFVVNGIRTKKERKERRKTHSYGKINNLKSSFFLFSILFRLSARICLLFSLLLYIYVRISSLNKKKKRKNGRRFYICIPIEQIEECANGKLAYKIINN